MQEIPATHKLPLELSFPKFSLGHLPASFSVTVTPADVERWNRIFDDRNPWYVGSSPFGEPVAPPSVLYYASQNVVAATPGLQRDGEAAAGGGGLARYRARFLAPIPVGRALEARCEVTEIYVRRGRGYLEWRTDFWDGERLVHSDVKTWMVGVGPDDIARHPERPAEPRAADEASAISTFGPLPLAITNERLNDFEGPNHPNDTTHTNIELARAAGFPNVRAQGAISFGLAARLLVDTFGERFFAGGTLDIRLLKAVYAGETLTARGEVLADEGGQVRCKVWCENPAGELIAVGTADVPSEAKSRASGSAAR